MKYDHRFRLKEKRASMRVYEADGVSMRLDFFEHILRVALLKEDGQGAGSALLPTWSVCPGGGDVPLEGRHRLSAAGFAAAKPEVLEDEYEIRFRHAGLDFTIEKKNFRIAAAGEKGVIYQDRNSLAYNFDGELGTGSAHYTRRFEGQRIFGLGDKGGPVNKSGRRFIISACDPMGFRSASGDPLYKQIPFYICSHAAGSYGIYYDTYSRGSMDFGAFHDNYFEPFNEARFEEEDMVFYLIFGEPKEIMQRFSAICGDAAEVPEWAFRYAGSTMEYTDAPDTDGRLRGFIDRCDEEGIRPGCFYLSSGYTQIGDQRCVFNWNTDKIPSPEALAAHFRERGVRLIPNVKPAFLDTHPMYDMIAEHGWFLHYGDGSPAKFPFWGGMASYLDFTNRDAYGFWKSCVKEQLVRRGYTDIWNDNNECLITDGSVIADGFGHPVPAARICPLFSYLMARASREACTEEGAEAPFNISRCAIAGTQRAASTWQGDNYTAFEELRGGHRQAMSMALTGFIFFGPDIGGFSGPKPCEELFLRWIQYGVFMPRFVLHSWKPGERSTMPWLYPGLMPEVKRLFDLRDKLVPYLFEEAETARKRHLPLIKPVFLEDPSYDVESDFFLCGDRILVCPVFDEGAKSVTVTLPNIATASDCGTDEESDGEAGWQQNSESAGWRLRGEGEVYKKGETLTVQCLPGDLPVWFCSASTAQ